MEENTQTGATPDRSSKAFTVPSQTFGDIVGFLGGTTVAAGSWAILAESMNTLLQDPVMAAEIGLREHRASQTKGTKLDISSPTAGDARRCVLSWFHIGSWGHNYHITATVETREDGRPDRVVVDINNSADDATFCRVTYTHDNAWTTNIPPEGQALVAETHERALEDLAYFRLLSKAMGGALKSWLGHS